MVAAVDDIHEGDIHGAQDSGFGARNIVSAFEKAAQSKGATIKYLAFTLY